MLPMLPAGRAEHRLSVAVFSFLKPNWLGASYYYLGHVSLDKDLVS